MTESLRSPRQKTLIYEILEPWEDNVQRDPDWSGDFPKELPEPTYEFLGFKLISPVVVAAGPSSGKPYSDFFLRMGFGIVTEKTKRTRAVESNPAPNIAIVRTRDQITRENINTPLEGTMDENEFTIYLAGTNSFGNPSSEMEVWGTELKEQLKEVGEGQLLALSVTATTPTEAVEDPTEYAIEDLLKAAETGISAGVKMIEFNLACPNVTNHPEEGQMYLDSYLVKEVMERAHQRFPGVKFGFKAGLYESKEQMRKVIASSGADFVSLINALSVPVVDKEGNDMLPGRRYAGLVGKPLRTLALEHIRWSSEIRKEEGLSFGIIGGGGVTSAPEIDEYMQAGADLVFSGIYVYHDPLLAHDYALLRGDL